MLIKCVYFYQVAQRCLGARGTYSHTSTWTATGTCAGLLSACLQARRNQLSNVRFADPHNKALCFSHSLREKCHTLYE